MIPIILILIIIRVLYVRLALGLDRFVKRYLIIGTGVRFPWLAGDCLDPKVGHNQSITLYKYYKLIS